LFGLILAEQQQLSVRRRKNIAFKNQQFFLLSDLKLNRCFKKQKKKVDLQISCQKKVGG